MPETPESICQTSVQDAAVSLQFMDVTDLKTLKKAVLYELSHGNRKTMIKNLKAKIKQLEKTIGETDDFKDTANHHHA